MAIDPVSLAITVGLMALQTAITASQHFEGARLDTVDVSVADPGTQIPRGWGTFRIDGCPYIWAEKLREVKKTSKTKGGKYTEYNYFGTWAILITDQGTTLRSAIDAVRRIWMDKHVVFQRGVVGPVTPTMGLIEGPFGIELKLEHTRNMRIYLGADDQAVDPRIEAWCEDRYGAPGMAPAYARKAIIVFEDIPLEKFGNRIPQCNVEAVRDPTTSHLWEGRESVMDSASSFAFGGGWGAHYNASGTVEWWDVGGRVKLGMSGTGLAAGSGTSAAAMGPDGTIYFVGVQLVPTVRYLVQISPLGMPLKQPIDTSEVYFGITRLCGGTILTTYGGGTTGYIEGAAVRAHAMSMRDACADADGDPWGLFQPPGTSSTFQLENLAPGALEAPITFEGDVERTGVSHARVAFLNGRFFIHGGDGRFYIVDRDTGDVVDSGVAGWGGVPTFRQQGESSFWAGNGVGDQLGEFSYADGSQLRAVDLDDWDGVFHVATTYEPLNHAFWARGAGEVRILYLDRVTGTGVELGEIAADVAGWCNVKRSDFSALDQLVKGWVGVQGNGTNWVEPLFTLHDSTVRPHNFTLQGIKRGAAAIGSRILTKDFAKDGDAARFKLQSRQDQELPLRLTINYSDETKEHQPNNVVPSRSFDAVDSRRTPSIDMSTLVSNPTEMKPLADRVLRRLWSDRESMFFALTAQELALEPGDVKPVMLDTLERTAFLERVTLTGGFMRLEAKRDHASIAALSSGVGAPLDGRDEQTVYLLAATRGLVLDIPLVSDAHDVTTPQLYIAATRLSAASSWPGAVAWRRDSTSSDFAPWHTLGSNEEGTLGIATTALGTARPWLWDRGNSVNVRLFGGAELSNVAEADVDADPRLNMAGLRNPTTGAIELFNFTTATLEADGSWTLSGLKRGRRGTEGAIASHAGGDEFFLVADLTRHVMGLSDVGGDEAFRVATAGRAPQSAAEQAMTPFTGATLKPYAPARVKAFFDGADWRFVVHRRTRLGGAWIGGSAIALGENSEAYELEILDGSGDVVRTLELEGTNEITYTEAQQIEDFGSVQVTKPDLVAYQLSDAVGRGFPHAA